jgi:hypothetical protein
MEFHVGKVTGEAKLFDPKTLQEIAQLAARIVEEKLARNKREEQERNLNSMGKAGS